MKDPKRSQPVTNWIPIVGHWSIEEGPTFLGGDPQLGPEYSFGICVSDVRLTEGEVEVTVELPELNPNFRAGPSARILLGYRSPQESYVTVGLGGHAAAFTVVQYRPSQGWQPIVRAGSPESLEPGRQYTLRVSLIGQRVSLSVDDIPVIEAVTDPMPPGQLGLFAWGNPPIHFADVTARVKRQTVFVVMEFSDRYKELYDHVIVPTVRKFDLEAVYGGTIYGPGVILTDIQREIINASIIIAEVTPPNPNVYYELGFAHALYKPTILLADAKDMVLLPFDIRGFRCLFYDNTIGGKDRIEAALWEHLRAITGQSPPR